MTAWSPTATAVAGTCPWPATRRAWPKRRPAGADPLADAALRIAEALMASAAKATRPLRRANALKPASPPSASSHEPAVVWRRSSSATTRPPLRFVTCASKRSSTRRSACRGPSSPSVAGAAPARASASQSSRVRMRARSGRTSTASRSRPRSRPTTAFVVGSPSASRLPRSTNASDSACWGPGRATSTRSPRRVTAGIRGDATSTPSGVSRGFEARTRRS